MVIEIVSGFPLKMGGFPMIFGLPSWPGLDQAARRRTVSLAAGR